MVKWNMYYFKGFKKEDVTKCINHTFDTKHPESLRTITEQWKTYAQSAEHISDKRQQFIIWFNGVNGIVLGALAGSFQVAHIGDIGTFLPILLLQKFLPILGVAISCIAITRIIVYRKRKRIKYAQIYTLEKQLPFRLYTNEYYLSNTGTRGRRFLRSGTRVEILFPIAFMIIYLVIGVWIAF